MKVYQQEISDGLDSAILANNVIACESVAVLSDDSQTSVNMDDLLQKIKAGANPDQVDLFYITSVLVSTGWNKNDDFFSTEATWAARNTPEDKQFNFMHNENDIIGHITGSYVVDREGNKVEAEEAPNDFDIVAEAVLYNSWTNPDNRERMQKIISEIQEGKWYVSMECLFAGFDYAVTGEDGTSKTVARNDESSFLTKHLRAYGGTGEYQGYKIGRSLKQISFSGKGLVAKPANPRSVILNASKADEQIVLQDLKQGDFNMSNDNLLEQQIADLKSELASAKEALEASKAKDNAEAFAALEQTVSEKEAECAGLQDQVKAHEATITELQETLAKDKEEMKEKMEELRKMQKEKKMATRKAALLEIGLEEEEAEESLASYEEFDDATFDTIVAAMTTMKKKVVNKVKKDEEEKEKAVKTEDEKPKAKMPTKKPTVAEEVEEEEAAAEEATEELFDGVESTEATLVDATDDSDELEATRASVAEWLENNVLSK
tara:strand:+ start:1953 stop:3428 length:1476 start_codon:yes stop_codon:yes gene_type:complete